MPQGKPKLPTPWSWTSGLQNCEKINFCCFKSSRLWHFVTATPANRYRGGLPPLGRNPLNSVSQCFGLTAVIQEELTTSCSSPFHCQATPLVQFGHNQCFVSACHVLGTDWLVRAQPLSSGSSQLVGDSGKVRSAVTRTEQEINLSMKAA